MVRPLQPPGKPGKKMPPFSVRLNEADYTFLVRKAQEAGIGLSTAGAQIVKAWIEEMRALEMKTSSNPRPLESNESIADDGKGSPEG
jgi:hypothetical protein